MSESMRKLDEVTKIKISQESQSKRQLNIPSWETMQAASGTLSTAISTTSTAPNVIEWSGADPMYSMTGSVKPFV